MTTFHHFIFAHRKKPYAHRILNISRVYAIFLFENRNWLCTICLLWSVNEIWFAFISRRFPAQPTWSDLISDRAEERSSAESFNWHLKWWLAHVIFWCFNYFTENGEKSPPREQVFIVQRSFQPFVLACIASLSLLLIWHNNTHSRVHRRNALTQKQSKYLVI